MNKEFVKLLNKHNFIIFKDDYVLISDKKGIAPIFETLFRLNDPRNFNVYDIIVGKAAASLFIKAGVCYVYGRVMSKKAHKMLAKYQIKHNYGVLVDNIINKNGDDICPMEKAVLNIDDIDECVRILKERNKELNE